LQESGAPVREAALYLLLKNEPHLFVGKKRHAH
jgi:hypothetical protein